jgi:hypothetical protein
MPILTRHSSSAAGSGSGSCGNCRADHHHMALAEPVYHELQHHVRMRQLLPLDRQTGLRRHGQPAWLQRGGPAH